MRNTQRERDAAYYARYAQRFMECYFIKKIVFLHISWVKE